MNDYLPEIIPITDLKNHVKACAELVASGKDVVLTKNGRGTMVLLDIDKYSEMLEDMQLQKAIITGEQQILEGSVLPWESAKKLLRAEIENA